MSLNTAPESQGHSDKIIGTKLCIVEIRDVYHVYKQLGLLWMYLSLTLSGGRTA